MFGKKRIVLKPYTPDPRAGWRPLAAAGLIVGLSLFCLVYGFFWALTAPYLMVQFAAPVLLLAMVAIWALPDSRYAPTRTMVGFFYVMLVTLFLWPNYLAVALPGLPWITMLRLTGFPMVLLLLVSVSVSSAFRRRIAEAVEAVPIVWKLLVAYSALQVVSIAFSGNMFHSVNRLVIYLVTCAATFFVAAYTFLRPGRIGRLAFVLWFMALTLAFIGVWEFRLGQLPWVGHIPSFLQVEDEAVQRILSGQTRSAIGVHRVQATFSTSLGLAEYIGLSMPFIIHLAFGPYRALTRVLALATVPLLFFVLVTTDSRLGMVGFFLAGVLYVLFWAVLRWRSSRESVLGPAVTLAYPAIFVGFIASTFFVGRLQNMIWGDGAHAASTNGRLEQYMEGIPLVLSRPWGYGLGMSGETLGRENAAGVITIDTYYLAVALDSGVLGFLTFYGMVLAVIWYGGKHAFKADLKDKDFTMLVPITICMVNFFVIKSVFSNADNHPLIFIVMGACMSLIHRFQTLEKTVPALAPAQAQAGAPRRSRRPAVQPASA